MGFTRILFTTDVHGSDPVWHKFIKGGQHYKAIAIILGGDIRGNGVMSVTRTRTGRILQTSKVRSTLSRTRTRWPGSRRYFGGRGPACMWEARVRKSQAIDLSLSFSEVPPE